jgi:hypothetical protein
MIRLLISAAFLGVVAAGPAHAQAPADQSRVMGVVTDGSGGALPGVTVTVAGTRTASVITDGSGRYMTPWLAPGTYIVTFVLSGFETRTLKNIPLTAGHTVVLDQQLPLAALTETVQVTATAPPPPPPPVAPTEILVPKPKVRPVEKEILASVCGPRHAADYTLAVGKIVSHQDANRWLLGPGDTIKALKTSSLGVIVYACGEIVAGDVLEPYVAQPAFFAVADGPPRYDEPGKILLGDHGRNAGTEGQMMVIDRGVMQGVQRGQRLTIFRPSGIEGRPNLIGDAVVVAVRADSATIMIGRTVDVIAVGDLVAPHR